MISKMGRFARCLCLALAAVSLLSQTADAAEAMQGDGRRLSGIVVDFETGEPVIGASIAVVGKKVGAISDLDGNFVIDLSQEDNELEFSCIGYKSERVVLKGEKKLTVMLHTDAELLEEAVAIGYGTTARKDLTGSIASVNVAEMKKAPVANFEEMLAGRVAGVSITSSDGQPGSDMNIVVRGNNSVTQDNSPLYVVDGFPMESSVGSMINPEEIESMQILKDASATAIYGARGANGVVLITTKKGKVGAPVITYNGWGGVQTVTKRMEMMEPYEFVRYQLDLDPEHYYDVYLNGERDLEWYKGVKGISWQDLLLRDAIVHNHNLSVRGGQ